MGEGGEDFARTNTRSVLRRGNDQSSVALANGPQFIFLHWRGHSEA